MWRGISPRLPRHWMFRWRLFFRGIWTSCVSVLDFQKTGGKLDMTAYCRALDFGCKAYVNLVMLHLIQKEIAEKAGIPCGKLILIVKSAHFYLRDREKVLAIIEKER